jgi:hypothetical protein
MAAEGRDPAAAIAADVSSGMMGTQPSSSISDTITPGEEVTMTDADEDEWLAVIVDQTEANVRQLRLESAGNAGSRGSTASGVVQATAGAAADDGLFGTHAPWRSNAGAAAAAGAMPHGAPAVAQPLPTTPVTPAVMYQASGYTSPPAATAAAVAPSAAGNGSSSSGLHTVGTPPAAVAAAGQGGGGNSRTGAAAKDVEGALVEAYFLAQLVNAQIGQVHKSWMYWADK